MVSRRWVLWAVLRSLGSCPWKPVSCRGFVMKAEWGPPALHASRLAMVIISLWVLELMGLSHLGLCISRLHAEINLVFF